MDSTSTTASRATGSDRTDRLFKELRTARHIKADRMFAILMTAQWAFAILLAVVASPYAWEGKVR